MTQMPVDASTARGYQPPVNTQFSVFLDNRVGRLMDLLEVFDQSSQLTLAGLSGIDSADHAVVRLLTSSADLCRRLLNRNEHQFSEIEVLAIELPYENSLLTVTEVLMSVELNIHYCYPLLVRPRGLPVVALHTRRRGVRGSAPAQTPLHRPGGKRPGRQRPGQHAGDAERSIRNLTGDASCRSITIFTEARRHEANHCDLRIFF